MGYIQAMEMVDLISLEQGIRWHLQYNYSPPLPCEMIPIAVKAVILCRQYKFNENLLVPYENRIGWMVPAYIVVETYHLEPWVNELKSDED